MPGGLGSKGPPNMVDTDTPAVCCCGADLGYTDLDFALASRSEAMKDLPVRYVKWVLSQALQHCGVTTAEMREILKNMWWHRKHMHNNFRCMMMAYAYAKGVIDRKTGWFVEPLAKIRYARHWPKDLWCLVEEDAIREAGHLKDRVATMVELNWLRANMGEWPVFRKAPSRSAVKDWLVLNRPGNEALQIHLLKLLWNKLAGGSKAALDDVAETTAADDGRTSELMQRLFGKTG